MLDHLSESVRHQLVFDSAASLPPLLRARLALSLPPPFPRPGGPYRSLFEEGMSCEEVVASGLTFEQFKLIRFAEERYQEPDLIAEEAGLSEEEFLRLPIEEQARRWERGHIERITEEWEIYYLSHRPEAATSDTPLPGLTSFAETKVRAV
jgi:hypothetical protein